MEPHSQTLPSSPLPAARVINQPPLRRLATPQLSVVIVNYRTWHDTARVVRQLGSSSSLKRGRAEITIVDNHSPPHPLAGRLRRWPGVALRRWGRNRGFARAVNEGCRLSRGDWFLLLNPDITLEPGFLDAALERVEALEPDVGIVGFGLRNEDGSPQLSTGPFPTLFGTLSRLLLPRHCRKYRPTPETVGSAVDWATGCCLLIRRACWEELGGFDADFFLYYEDVDLCRRARAAGWSVRFEPDLRLVHHQPLHARPVLPHLRFITRHALLTYGLKHWPPWQARVLAGVVRLEAWLRQGLAWRRGDDEVASLFHQLGRLAGELAAGEHTRAARRLRRVVQREEAAHDSAALHHHSQP